MTGFNVKPRIKPPVNPAALDAFAAGADADKMLNGVVNTVGLDDKRRNPCFPLRLTERELAGLKNIAATTPDSMHQFCIRAIRLAMNLPEK